MFEVFLNLSTIFSHLLTPGWLDGSTGTGLGGLLAIWFLLCCRLPVLMLLPLFSLPPPCISAHMHTCIFPSSPSSCSHSHSLLLGLLCRPVHLSPQKVSKRSCRKKQRFMWARRDSMLRIDFGIENAWPHFLFLWSYQLVSRGNCSSRVDKILCFCFKQ